MQSLTVTVIVPLALIAQAQALAMGLVPGFSPNERGLPADAPDSPRPDSATAAPPSKLEMADPMGSFLSPGSPRDESTMGSFLSPGSPRDESTIMSPRLISSPRLVSNIGKPSRESIAATFYPPITSLRQLVPSHEQDEGLETLEQPVLPMYSQEFFNLPPERVEKHNGPPQRFEERIHNDRQIHNDELFAQTFPSLACIPAAALMILVVGSRVTFAKATGTVYGMIPFRCVGSALHGEPLLAT